MTADRHPRDQRPSPSSAGASQAERMLDAHTVADVMTPDVICVPPWAALQEIERILVKYRVRAVPVVDGAHRLLGAVSEVDLVRARKRDRHTHRLRRGRARSRMRVNRQCAWEL